MIYILRDKATPEQVVEMLKEYESMIEVVQDLRPGLGNRSTSIQSEEVRQQVAAVETEILGGIRAA